MSNNSKYELGRVHASAQRLGLQQSLPLWKHRMLKQPRMLSKNQKPEPATTTPLTDGKHERLTRSSTGNDFNPLRGARDVPRS